MAVDIKDIEDLLVDRIKDQLPYLYRVDSFESRYGLEIDELLVDAPAVLCSMEAAARKPDWEYFDGMVVAHRFILAVLARDMRGPDEAKANDLVGAYRILNDLRTALQSYQLSASLSPLELNEETFVAASQIGIIYRAVYTTCEAEE